MPDVVIFSDPHVGLRRTANTTPTSSARLREAINEQLADIIGRPAEFRICGGDWFDTFSNEEGVIASTYPLIKEMDLVLAGNHDLVNIKGKMGSLGLLKEMLGNTDAIPINDVGESNGFLHTYENHLFFSVPHCSTQELFEKAVDATAKGSNVYNKEGRKKYLLLHCNYNSNFSDGRQTDLNLTRAKAAELVDHFDYIILGHEHNPYEDFQGKLIVLGNIHPTSFSDITDKRIMTIGDDGVKFVPVWKKSKGYQEINWQDLEESYPHQFIKITGTAKAENLRDIMKAAKTIEKNSPNLFALKMDVEIEGLAKMQESCAEDKSQTIVDKVEQSLESTPELLELWKEFAK